MEQAVFDMEATFGLSNIVLEENLGIFKNKVLPTGTLSQTPDLKKFCQNLSAVGKIRPIIVAIFHTKHWPLCRLQHYGRNTASHGGPYEAAVIKTDCY